MPILQCDAFSFAYPGAAQNALNNLSFQIFSGEFVAVTGANNAGKSSLCYALTGVISHLYQGKTRGSVRICGTDTAESTVAEIAESVAFVMQKPEHQLSGVRFTVFEEVAFTLENRGMEKEAIRQRVAQTLEMLQLSDVSQRSPHQLSGGQLQKVVLAAALAGDSPVLVLDEPTTFLDPVSARQTFDILSQLREAGKTIVIAEQRLDTIAAYADRVIALHQGACVLDGPPADVLASPVMQKIGLDWTRYTKVAELARRRRLWPADTPLATTLSETARGLESRSARGSEPETGATGTEYHEY